MKRYKKIVFETEKDITFEVSECTSEKLIIKALNIATTEISEKTSEESIIEAQAISTTEISEETSEESIIEAQDISTTEISEETGEESIIEAQDIFTTEVSEKTSEESIIRNQKITTANIYSENYANPPIPEGYKHVCGGWNNGFVIERDSDGSQFVWIPVGSLAPNGTLDGEHFSEKFGRRNYMNDKLSDKCFNEPLNGELLKQIESVKKYGGFYISRYNISKSPTGKPRSVKGVMPWVYIYFVDAKKVASTIEDTEAVKSHLTFGAEYDSVLEWFIQTKVKTHAEIAKDSTEWGNYCDTNNSPQKIVETGSREEWSANNIYDFAGNVKEWTQEQMYIYAPVVRGGCAYSRGGWPVSFRIWTQMICEDFSCIGFRATLYIK